jgi:hypothetical protein
VICGNAFYDYEHIEPEFKDAKEHNPDCMALLCRDCHGRVPHFLSKQAVWEGRRAPKCKSTGFSFGPLDVGKDDLTFVLGGLTFRNPSSILRVFDHELLRVEGPEAEGGPLRVSASFYDEDGKLTARIDRNRLIVITQVWDAEVSGGTVTFRRAAGDIALRLIFFPRKGIQIDRLRLLYRGVVVEVQDDVVRVGNQYAEVRPSRVLFHSCWSCIAVTDVGISFGEPLGPNASVMRGGAVTYNWCAFGAGLRVIDGTAAVLENCRVSGGVSLEGRGRLELRGGVVIGTKP